MVIVTGGAGFIGSHFVNSTKEETVIIDKMNYAADIRRLAGSPTISRADIRDRRSLKAIFRRYEPRAVVHFAAQTHVTRSIYWPADFIEDNIEGTFRLLQESLDYWKEHKDFVFLHVSTDEVFGNLGEGENPFTETSPYNPSTPYAATKASADHLVRSYQTTYGLPTIIVHPTNNFGPNQHEEKLIPLMVKLAKHNMPLTVHGNGLGTRDWIHVEDTCDAIRLILDKGAIGESYCIGARNEKTVLSVVEEVKEKTGSQSPIVFVEDRPGNDRRYALNPEKLGKLGWFPKREFSICV